MGNPKDLVHITPLVMEDPIEQIMREVEAHIEAEIGWDARPTFLALHKAGDLGFGAVDMNWLPDMLFANPAQMLPSFTAWLQNFLDAGTDVEWMKTAFAPALPSFYGCLIVSEGWAVTAKPTEPGETRDEAVDKKLGGLTPSEHPDRKEMRSGVGYTIDGRILALGRIRGETPMFYSYEPGANDPENPVPTGRVIDSLKLFVQQIQQIAAM
jgi:hypothetical protein